MVFLKHLRLEAIPKDLSCVQKLCVLGLKIPVQSFTVYRLASGLPCSNDNDKEHQRNKNNTNQCSASFCLANRSCKVTNYKNIA